MPRILYAGRLILSSMLLCLLASAPVMALGTYYVSPTGSDSNTGGLSDPFLTITHARDGLRLAGGGTVYLRGGTYTLTSTVVFDQRDSNSTYQAYSGEVPIISGGVALTSWTLYSGDIYRASVNWNFRGLFKDGVRLYYRNPVTWTQTSGWTITVGFTDSAGPSSLVNAGDWTLDYVNGFVYYKTGGGAPTGTIIAGSLGKLFQITGTSTASVLNIQFNHLYFYYNNWLSPSTTYTDSWVGTFKKPTDSTYIGEIPGAVEVEFANNASFVSCRIAHNASSGIAFGRGVTNSQVVGSEVYDNAANGIRFGYMGNTTADGYRVWRDPNGQTLTYAWYGNASWIEDRNTATNNYVHDNAQLYPTAANIDVSDISNVQINYNRTDTSLYSSIVAYELFGTAYKADYNHVSNANTLNSLVPDGGGIYSLSGQLSPNVGITAEYIGNLVHDTFGYGALYADQSNDQFTVNNNVTYNIGGSVQPGGNPVLCGANHCTLSGNNTTPTQAQISAAAASTGPQAPYNADLFGGDVTVTFADRADSTPLTGLYAGIDWGSQLWYTGIYLGTHFAWVNSSSTSAVVQTFTLPAGKVLKGVTISGGGTVKLSSSGNPDVTFSPTATFTTYTTGWTTAAAVVTVTITCTCSAYSDGFTNIVYGTPSPADTTVTFADRPDNTALTGVYGGIDWGSQLWYTGIYLGTHFAWVNSSSTSAVVQTFTLPAGKVLKGVTISGGGTVKLSSSGNPDVTFSPPATFTTYTTGWTAAAAVVTVTITCSCSAYSDGFTNIIYGSP